MVEFEPSEFATFLQNITLDFISESSIVGQNVHETHAANKKFELYCVHIRAFFIVG